MVASVRVASCNTKVSLILSIVNKANRSKVKVSFKWISQLISNQNFLQTLLSASGVHNLSGTIPALTTFPSISMIRHRLSNPRLLTLPLMPLVHVLFPGLATQLKQLKVWARAAIDVPRVFKITFYYIYTIL